MTAAALAQPEPFEVPEGGLASFLTATEGDWSDASLDGPESGYVIQMADKLAEYGREGDTKLAHVAPGETVVPLEVLDADPELKSRLFAQMRDMGLEPERYVVGNELNSLNPTTGQPEFFLKKVFKGIKKAVKGVVKVFKKIAPIVLPIALGFALGPAGLGLSGWAAGAASGGISSLIQGGSLKDALKGAAIGGLIGGVTTGFEGGLMAPESAVTAAPTEVGVPSDIVEGATEAAGVVPSGSELVQQAAEATAQGTPLSAGQATQQALNPLQQVQQSAAASQNAAAQLGLPGATQTAMPLPANASPTSAAVNAQKAAQMSPVGAASQAAPTGIEQVAGTNLAANIPSVGESKSFFDTAGDYLFRAGKSTDQVQAIKNAAFKRTYTDTLARYKGLGIADAAAQEAALKAAEAAAASAGPTLFGSQALAKYGPSALGVAGLLAATGQFDVPEMEAFEPYGGMTGAKLLAQNPGKYELAQPGSGYQPIVAARGGPIQRFPRRTGPIRGPGTETSDDIPAMLSDGEFVMTARAVRGAGNGSREKGMRRMYDMMRKFEGGAIRGH